MSSEADPPLVAALPIDADRMHRPDLEMTRVMLSYVADRLLTPEVPLDGLADREHLEEVLAGLISEEGHDFHRVLDVYTQHLALTVLSADSPRMFTFIPSAPTKASLLFDMVVSAASLQGISWFEAAGAVMAENQALRALADIAGMPETTGGVFVSGGSAGNLSALVVARDTARRRRVDAGLPDVHLRVVVSDQAHSSIANTLGITAMQPVVVPTPDGRLTGEVLREAVNNAIRHGRASTVEIRLALTAPGADDVAPAVTIAVRDDGRGGGVVGPGGLGSRLYDELCRDWSLERDVSGTTFRGSIGLA